jgi:arsenate reductase (thioredoxin)
LHVGIKLSQIDNKKINMLYKQILDEISTFDESNIPTDRKEILKSLVDFIFERSIRKESINLNFICTHNSRRSHLAQIWAQVMAYHFGIDQVTTYSGGTEETAMFYKIKETILAQGFQVIQLSDGSNPVYAIKYSENSLPIICFSKAYNHHFNPSSQFAAILTCNSADEKCPFVIGADARIPIKYNDPKAYDNTDLMEVKYRERSREIAQELWWVFAQIKSKI